MGYQSVKDSGVLGEALRQSSEKWLKSGVFERYWSKYSRKKAGSDVRHVSPKDMVELGPCTIYIKPHILQAKLFGVREPKSESPSPLVTQRPLAQRGASNGHTPSNLQASRSAYSESPSRSPNPPSQTENVPSAEVKSEPQVPKKPYQSDPHHVLPPSQSASPAPPHPIPRAEHHPHPQPSPDPVIQMLAQKAATDPELKELMRIVAQGNGSQEQLRAFQGHIDQLNALLGPQHPKFHPASTLPPSQASHTAPAQPYHQSPASPAPPYQPSIPNPYRYPSPTTSTTTTTPAHPKKSSTARSKPTPTFSAILIEFCESSHDRYLFPPSSILQSLTPTSLLASFLITRSGAGACDAGSVPGGFYKEGVEYYQPVTARVEVLREGVLEALLRTARSKEDVVRHMAEVMARCMRAEDVGLALRLPAAAPVLLEKEQEKEEEKVNLGLAGQKGKGGSVELGVGVGEGRKRKRGSGVR